MLNLLNYFLKFPTLKGLNLKSCPLNLSLNRLQTGVDNVRYDVCLSAGFCKIVKKLVLNIIANKTHTVDIINSEASKDIIKERQQFKKFCREIMLNGVNRAKMEKNAQIDILVQIAVIKLLISEIPIQYEILIKRLKNIIQGYETASNQDDALALKNKLTKITQDHAFIKSCVGNELFEYLIEVQHGDLNEIRQVNFGKEAVIPDEFFLNPVIYAENPSDDYFMLQEYNILLGHRIEDPDKYHVLYKLIQKLLLEIYMKDERITHNPENSAISKNTEEWLKQVENVDLLFNCFQSKYQYKKLKKENSDKDILDNIARQTLEQKKRLLFFYKNLKKSGIIKRIIAAYEIQPIYLYYCPPLVPQLILQFFISRRARKSVKNRLKKLSRSYNKSFSIAPLQKKRLMMYKLWKSNKKGYLIRFLKDFIRYHRDLQYLHQLQEAMDAVNLTSEEKILNLSRANNTLYEFLLSHEQVSEEKPIINHVIIKADVRGSTDITHKMMKRGLNPASYFSLNFFDPITEILSEYGAQKVFVEGDAIILSIFERQETPEGWYSVARACGLASKILQIVKQCNIRSIKNRLPIIELGIGISYYNSVPAFLFDGEHQIMISSAINKADRLSGCSKFVRKKMVDNRKPFKLYVFQTVSEQEIASTKDDLFLRYNVNGIEINSKGFQKLKQEIDLKRVHVNIRALQKNKVRFYTGKFPTVTGNYQRLIIRESRIPKIDPETFNVISLTTRKYYEVCTNSKLHKYIKKVI